MIIVSARPHYFSASGRYLGEMSQGESLGDLIDAIDLPQSSRDRLIVEINGHQVPAPLWHNTYPKDMTTVDLVAIYSGGDSGKQILGFVAMLALSSVTFGVGGYLSGLGWGAVSTAAVQGGMMLLGTLAISALFAPPEETVNNEGEYYSFQGMSNRARPNQAIMQIYGKIRAYPDICALPYIRSRDGNEFITSIFCYGYGKIDISETFVGNIKWPDLKDSNYLADKEFVAGHTLRYYTDDVHYESMGITLLNDVRETGIHYPADAWFHVARSAKNADKVVIDFYFPEGCWVLGGSGSQHNANIGIWVFFRKVGATAWTNISTLTNTIQSPKNRTTFKTNSNTNEQFLNVDYKRLLPFMISIEATMPTNGQYEFKMGRSDYPGGRADDPDTADHTRTVVRAIQTITAAPPIAPKVPLSTFEVEIKASNQISGTVDNLSSLCQAYIPYLENGVWKRPVYDPGNYTWSFPATANPAWVYLDILKGQANANPLLDEDIDLDAFVKWAAYCDSRSPSDPNKKYCTCSFVHTQSETVDQLLQKVASCGNASRHVRDSKQSIIWDAEAPFPTQLFTERNTSNFKLQKDFLDQPHGIRVSYLDETDDYKQAEVIAYSPGYDADSASKMEDMEAFGATDREQARRAGLRFLAMGRYRNEVCSFDADIEHMASERGDRIRVAFSAVEEGGIPGRITALSRNTAGAVTEVTLDQRHYADPATLASSGLLFRSIHTGGATHAMQIFTAHVDAIIDDYTLHLAAPIPREAVDIQEGDLTVFGPLVEIEEDWLISKVEPGQDLTATIYCTPYAPEMQYISNGGLIPDPTT